MSSLKNGRKSSEMIETDKLLFSLKDSLTRIRDLVCQEQSSVLHEEMRHYSCVFVKFQTSNDCNIF